jgi:alkanesulfonate monooxygenase SsuD/methylene tetrahydromethanopterin reductase-like flavin-dependent oxidoreductase (luciferase family)
MRFGLALPHYGFSMPDARVPSVADIAAIARDAEGLGFDSVHVSDHLFLDIGRYGGPSGRSVTPEAFGSLHAIAAATSRIGLGTLVLCAPFRNPALLGQQVRTLQDASGGRFTCGIGAGWYEDEFVEAGIEFGTAGQRIDAMRACAERLYAEGDARIIIGGKGGPRILDAVASAAHGWNVCWRTTVDFVADRRAALEKRCAEIGRDPGDVEVTVGLYALVARDEDDLARRYEALRTWAPGGALADLTLERWAEDALVGTIDALVPVVRGFAEAGVAEIIVSPASLPFALADREQLDLISQLAKAAA